MKPRKYRPKSTTTAPHTASSAMRCATRNDPSVPASAPIATNTAVKPSTNPSALRSTTGVRCSSPAAKYVT